MIKFVAINKQSLNAYFSFANMFLNDFFTRLTNHSTAIMKFTIAPIRYFTHPRIETAIATHLQLKNKILLFLLRLAGGNNYNKKE